MKTPWINHSKMQEVNFQQESVFKSSTSKFQKVGETLSFLSENEESEQTGKDIFEFDTVPNHVNVNEKKYPSNHNNLKEVPEPREENRTGSAFNFYKLSQGKDSKPVSKEDDEERPETAKNTFKSDTVPSRGHVNPKRPLYNKNVLKRVFEKYKEDHPGSRHHFYESSNGMDSKQVSKVDDFDKTDNVLKLVESTDCIPRFETISADEKNEIAQTDLQPTESEIMDEMKDLHDKEEVVETQLAEYTGEFVHDQGKVCYMTKKSPFSIHVEIDDFHHAPICGDVVQNTFEFLDLNNKQAPELDTKLINTTTYYPEQPDCRLVCSKIHEFVFLSDNQNEGKNSKSKHYKSVVVPMHDSQFKFTAKAEESNHHSFVHIRVPVVLGEYKIEVCLEENVAFNEGVMGIKEISKEVVISNCRLVPTVLSPSLNNGTRTVLKGNLLIEGNIFQKIEYNAFPNKNTKSLTPLNQLHQKMVVELIVHVLQVQQVQVKR